MPERQLTSAPHGHVLTNAAVWSADGRWIVFDTRSTPDGGVFDGTRIGRVDVETGRVETLYESQHGACCGVVTASPVDDRVVFILGPEHPTVDWSYGPARRQGVVVHADHPGAVEPLDARDLTAPFTPGALRGGSHVHIFSGDGRLVSFTYEDAVLDADAADPARERNRRGIAVSVCGRPVSVPHTHPRNHDGTAWSVVLTRLSDVPTPGSDEIGRACEEGWIGSGTAAGSGRRGLAFQGEVVAADGRPLVEAFSVELPDDPADLERPGDGPLAGTITTRPRPPRGVVQRRLTHTADRPHPGIQGPRHWLRSSPDGSRIGCLMRDDAGHPQLWLVSRAGGGPLPLTRDPWPVASAFTWSPDGGRIAYIADGSVMTVDVDTGRSTRLTDRSRSAVTLRPEAVVFAPDGRRIAVVRTLPGPGGAGPHNQICLVEA